MGVERGIEKWEEMKMATRISAQRVMQEIVGESGLGWGQIWEFDLLKIQIKVS